MIEVGVTDEGGNLGRFVVGRVVAAGKHPNADRLQLCQVDVGEAEPQQIVCGAWNFGAGATVAVGLPGRAASRLPGAARASARSAERSREGMILAEDEIGLGSDHAGIMLLPDGLEPGDAARRRPAARRPRARRRADDEPARPAVDGRDRARGGSALRRGAPAARPVDPPVVRTRSPSDIRVEDFEGARATSAGSSGNVAVGPSPQWMRAGSTSAGMRSISNVVDVTNYVMHVCGSPLHAFDRSKLAGGRIVVRRASRARTCGRSTGRERTLESDLLITDGERAVALAAIMGGLESEVCDETTEVLLEAANFEPIGVLKTSERLALRTEGSNRWEKGVDPYAAEPAAVLASRLLVDLTGAALTGSVDVQQGLPERPVVTLRPERASHLIGIEVPEDEQRGILERLGFEVAGDMRITVPTWRARDVTREIDLVEEVARVVLDRVPHTMPLRRAVAGHLTPMQRFRRTVEDILVGAGFSEAYTWSLTASDPTRTRFVCRSR